MKNKSIVQLICKKLGVRATKKRREVLVEAIACIVASFK